MPNFWAHRICAGITLDRLEGAVAGIIKSNAASYRLGSQGADLMYFRPMQLLKGRQGVVYHAKMLHGQPVEKLAGMSRKYLAGQAGKKQFESTFAYVCGFLCHHSVDQSVHPFIDANAPSLLRHRRIELDFDAYMSRELDVRPDSEIHHWTGISGFIGFAGMAQWYNFMFHGLFNMRFSLRSYVRDYKAMKRMSGILDKPRRLMKEKHVDRHVLPEAELKAMLKAAIQGAWNATDMINQIYSSLEEHIPVEESDEIPAAVPLWIGI